ncbi:MAG TPA: hypothetical protein P5081_10700 [Phycisphaerae bacterium]|nr:hypothetical protein [Phycisphaerae bacterium]HRW53347.1 hypothetical protein [Phycisphaerae bacterium]
MKPSLFVTALDESIKFGQEARLMLTFAGNEDALHIQPLAYTRVEDSGFRIDIRTSDIIATDLVDDVLYVDSDVIETAELQVKEAGKTWREDPYDGINDDYEK